MSLVSIPKPDELEVSLFGPGVGECVVVHLGQGEWLVVDSCIDPRTRQPVALDYLDAVGVNVETALKRVVVTHWHDDHMRGASHVVRRARDAKFVCSMALQQEDFKRFIVASRSLNVQAQGSSGVDEFSSILATLQERRLAGARTEAVGPVWACGGQLLYRRPASGTAPECEVFALSPSSATLSRGLHEISRLLPRVGAPKRAAVSVEPNETSLVICVRVGNAQALLGSDLENTKSPDTGWGAVLTNEARPTSTVHVFKVPHHGSENAHQQEVWNTMLSKDPIAILTPFARGRTALPTDADRNRMKRHTSQLFCTAPRSARGTVPDPMVQRTVREVAREFRNRTSQMGHIRVRLSATSTAPRVELFGLAFAA